VEIDWLIVEFHTSNGVNDRFRKKNLSGTQDHQWRFVKCKIQQGLKCGRQSIYLIYLRDTSHEMSSMLTNACYSITFCPTKHMASREEKCNEGKRE
jgi:hypothetical protein